MGLLTEYRESDGHRPVPVDEFVSRTLIPRFQDLAAEGFDRVVARIEASRVEEQTAGAIIAS